MRHLLRPVQGAGHVGLHAPLLQTLHLQVLERNAGPRELPAVPQGVQLQALPDQLPGDRHGGEGPGHHLGLLHQEPRGEFRPLLSVGRSVFGNHTAVWLCSKVNLLIEKEHSVM